MKKTHSKWCLALLYGLGLTAVQAQETVTTSGGNASGATGSVSYTVGQTVYTTQVSGAGSVAQGVQQPFEISIVTSLDEKGGREIQLSAYPNPTADQLTLTSEKEPVDLSYQLFDLNGKLLTSGKVVSKQTLIKIDLFPAATYILQVNDNTATVKTFKITKN